MRCPPPCLDKFSHFYRFWWVYCQLKALRRCHPESLRRNIENLPKTLDATYERVLRGIDEANREYARRLLQCLTVALRPLRVEELAEVLAIDFDAASHGGTPQLNPKLRWTDPLQAIQSICSSLIVIVGDGDSQVVQFSHLSVKEFLTSNRLALSRDLSEHRIFIEDSHAVLAQACLGVLFQLDDGVNKDNIGSIPLAKYAAQYWVDHAWFENVHSHIRDAIDHFLEEDRPHWAAWCRVQMTDVSWSLFTPSERADGAFPLYYASLGGFYRLTEHLVRKHPEHINARGGRMVTPLVATLRRKHFQVAELLLQHGADVNVEGELGITPLRAACESGALDIVEWLLNHGANVNTQDAESWTPLHDAACYGRLEISRMLIKHKADIQLQNNLGEFPLHLAARPCDNRGHLEIIQSLLDYGADPNARDNSGSTPLHCSSWLEKQGYVETQGTVEGTLMLLEKGANIDAKDNWGRTPLQVALEIGRRDIVACLKERGATEVSQVTETKHSQVL